MFAKWARRDASEKVWVSSPERKGRGVGVFSSGHLTAIIVAVVVMVGLPVGAFAAVSGANSFITDAVSGAHAKVTSAGNLQTSVTGSVSATAAAPGAAFVKLGTVTGTGHSCGFLTPPAGKAMVITAIDEVPVGAAVSFDAQLNVLADTATACAGTKTSIANGFYGSDNPHEVVLNPGLGLKNGHYLDLNVAITPGGAVTPGPSAVYVYGYTVPAASCTTGCL
jgi:hypothetical protein